MKKIKMTVTQTLIYEPNKEYYPEGFTIEQMADTDASAEDVDLLMNNDNTDLDIKWEIVECEED